MPHFRESSSSSSTTGIDINPYNSSQRIVSDDEYAALSPDERPLSEQLEPIAVVGMAFESAGLTLDQLSVSDTACFMATFTADFQQMSFKEPSFRHSLAATGVDPGLLSNRVSHVFNLRGPSIVVNTACSSSVYALHNACNALRTHECSAAVVGGSNLILTVDQHMNTGKLGVLSPTSTCHTFNSYANGYGRAEGVGAIYFKRLSDAVRDGDPIRGVIRSSATNNNGKAAGVGITYPGFDGQRNVMRHAYQRSGLDPMLTGYFESHGTGTAIGDPLEVHAVSDIMNSTRTDADGPLNIGAVKTNIGHSEAASGLSAIIKAILMVERGIIPPTHGVADLNPKIDWKGWRVHVPTDPTPMPRHLPVMRVSVNSFGYGGTNAHVIVESPKSLLSMPQNYKYSMHGHSTKTKLARGAVNRSRPYLLVFSAHDAGALKRNAVAHGKVAAKVISLSICPLINGIRPRSFGPSLVRLTIGGSLKEPTWRNVLRLKDLPWLRDHSLGGEAVFPAAGYLSMAMEAITQLNEMSQAPLEIDSYIFRDISIQQALVTPDDDEGIETLFNMRPSRLITDEAMRWWDFNTSSVSTEGHAKNHMNGRICINTNKGRALPKAVPNLPQRASGKLWNQALKKVGFNYGPTFQDMDNITFDGMSYCAQATTNIKSSVMKDESRHVLHPAILDSCLQLMIVAIWAGRASAMKFGAVPVTAEEIIVWKPTQAQLHGSSNAKAFSWIDPRGQRVFNAHNQLLADDGQFLMQIKCMQCTAYEAAIPQSLEDVTRPQPYSQIVSRPDFSLLSGSQNHLSLADFIELAQFKKPSLKVLVSSPATATALLARLPELCLTVATDDAHAPDVTEELSGFTNVSIEHLALTVSLTTQSQEKLKFSFDIIATPSTSLHDLQNIRELLSEDGCAVLGGDVSALSEQRLKDVGFSGIESFLGESLFVTRIEKTRNPSEAPIWLLHHTDPPSCAHSLECELEKAGFTTERLRLGNTCPAGANVIALVDLEVPFMANMSEDEFLHIQTILGDASKVLWISCSDASKDVARPEYAMTAGLLRSLRSERASLKATLVDFSIGDLASEIFTTRTSRLASAFFTGEQELETEYTSKDGQLLINRLIPFDRINETYALTDNETQSQPFDPEVSLDGTIDSGKIVFSHCKADEVVLQPNEVEFRVLATGLTDEDKSVILGSSPGPNFSHEASGIVTRTGDAVTRVSPGNRMVAFSAGRLSSFQRVPESLIQKLHDCEDHETTAGLPMYYGPTLYGLETLAKLEPKESVLILPGSGGVGGAAIRVTQALGGRVFVAVGSDTEAEELQSSFGLSRDQTLVDYTPELLQEYEIDVVFSGSSVEPGISQESGRNMPALSRFVNCGQMPAGSSLDSVVASRGASYLSVNFIGLFKRPQVLGRLLERIMALYRDGSLPVPPLTISSVSAINSSLTLSSSLKSSETIITYTKGSTLEVARTPPRLELHADATYLLVGCLGGLGRSLTTWMMKRGARNFAFLSRSGTDSEQAALRVQDLEARGAKVQVFRGDAAIKGDVERAVASIPSDMPLRGIVNDAMVLRDGLFQNMSYESWTTSIQPKVLGSKNLHEATSELPLDFFLMTSSVSGILGTPAQGNYAAANSYMDALARLRRSQGKPACAVVLPMVLGVGVVAENLDLENSLTRKGMYGIDEEALLNAFEVSILEQQGQQDGSASFDHLVVGLDPAELHRATKEAEGDVDAFWAGDQRFSILLDAMHQLDGANHGDGEAGSILSRVKAASSPAQAISLVRDHFVSKLARVLLLDVEEFSDESSGRSIASYGIDSMVGAELRNWIFKELGLDIAFQQLLSPSLTIHKFAELICVSQGIFMDAE
ncbi:polyketide synthase [Fusarium circinatum]|uniref:Polyketide synthase n=1 Tax=Fusarium circinatum TaxID=48490 RepID=A0A8H5T9W4_FUSCI|nr:polyketide synthase [Fusarium circinatum]